MRAKLFYIHDPMCSWCWGFSYTLGQLLAGLPPSLQVIRLLGGLAVDTDEAMPQAQQQAIMHTWRRIEVTIPGVKFNYDFWQSCQPRRSTYPACRAVIAARQQGACFDASMTGAIQLAYYQEARNPSDNSLLIELAAEIGLDIERFSKDLLGNYVQSQLLKEMKQAKDLGVEAFPSLVLKNDENRWHIPIDYNDPIPMLKLIDELLHD